MSRNVFSSIFYLEIDRSAKIPNESFKNINYKKSASIDLLFLSTLRNTKREISIIE